MAGHFNCVPGCRQRPFGRYRFGQSVDAQRVGEPVILWARMKRIDVPTAAIRLLGSHRMCPGSRSA